MMATPPASHAHPADFPPVVPQLLHVVLDARDARREAEFWRMLLGLVYRAGDEGPEPGHPSVSHLDTTVPSRSALDAVHDLVLELGGELRLDRTDDPEEPLRAYASPEGHIFCVFVA